MRGWCAPLLCAALVVGCQSGDEPSAPSQASMIARVEAGLAGRVHVVGEPADAWSLADRMKFHNVPGVGIAVLVDGKISWAKGHGVLEAGKPTPVDAETIFQVASISKPVTGLAALRMVEQGRLALDAQINDYLRSWQVPDNDFTTQHPVTLRQLLSHSAGLTVHGFPGYAAGVPVPTVPQVLDGAPPANTPAVRVDKVPGESWRYSGGGYTVMQLAMTDVAGQSFSDLVRELVLEPAGMTRSAFSQPLPEADRANAATAHRVAGVPVPGHSHTYPEMAAAGLWSTPSDLLRLALAVVAANNGERGAILSPELTRQMLTIQSGGFGLGFAVDELADGKVFSHSGGNEGFISMLFAYADGRGGAAVMTNGPNGGALANEILASIAAAYGWQYGVPEQRTALTLTPERAAQFSGVYVASDDEVFVRVSPLLPFDVDADGRPVSILLAPGFAAVRQAQ